MDKYPVLAGGETVGELTVEAAASDTVLDMSCVRREGCGVRGPWERAGHCESASRSRRVTGCTYAAAFPGA